MIRVMTETEIRQAGAQVYWQVRNGGLIDQDPKQLEHGYYVVEFLRGESVDERDSIEIISPGPYADPYFAEHIATTRHGMTPQADEDDYGQDDLPW